ncbi:MAG: GNAT family N-acetyltransferase [Lachnospiraceae bacterium]|nr:GNAT family N-acetyltransferase [Lachnospiraceae bacterium]
MHIEKCTYDAYFFVVGEEIVGYALVKNSCKPLYLRQFLIDRKYRKQHLGTEAFHELLKYLEVENIDIEVLPWNEAGLRFWSSLGFKEISKYMRYKA